MQPAAAPQGKASRGQGGRAGFCPPGWDSVRLVSPAASLFPLLRGDLLLSSHPTRLPECHHVPESPQGHGTGMTRAGKHRESPAPRRGALVMQTLGMELQASSSWSGSVPCPSGGEGPSPRRRRTAPHGKKGNAARSPTALPEQVLRQGQHEGQARGHGTALAPGKSPALVPWPPLGRRGRCSCCHPRRRQGDRWVPRTAGTRRVQGDLRSKRSGLVPFLAPGLGDTSGSSSPPPRTAPDLQTPGEGDRMLLPSPTAAAQQEGDSAPHTHARTPSYTSTTAWAWVPAQGAPLLQEKVLMDSVSGW